MFQGQFRFSSLRLTRNSPPELLFQAQREGSANGDACGCRGSFKQFLLNAPWRQGPVQLTAGEKDVGSHPLILPAQAQHQESEVRERGENIDSGEDLCWDRLYRRGNRHRSPPEQSPSCRGPPRTGLCLSFIASVSPPASSSNASNPNSKAFSQECKQAVTRQPLWMARRSLRTPSNY